VLSQWKAETGERVRESSSVEIMGRLAISPDGKRLVTGGSTGWIGVFDDILERKNLFECGGRGGLYAFRLLDSQRLIVGTYKGSVLLMDLETGEELARFEPLRLRIGMPIRAIDYDPRRQLVAAVGGWDGEETMRVYSLKGLQSFGKAP